MAKSQLKGRWSAILIRSALGFGILAFVFWSIDLRAVVTKFIYIRPTLAFALCFTAIMDRVLMAYKWNLLLRARRISLSLWQAIHLYFVGNLLGTFTPGAIGADAYRISALSRFHKNQVTASTVILERLIGLAVIATFALVALPISAQYIGKGAKSIVWTIMALAILVIIAVLISLRPSIVERIARRFPYMSRISIAKRLRDFYLTYAESRSHSRALLAFTLLTAFEVILLVGISYLAARSLVVNVSFGYFLCIIPLLHILIRLPVSFQGIGIQEGLFAYFLMAGGFSAADGLSISLLLRMAEMISVFLPGAVLLCICPFRLRPSANPTGN